MSNPNLNQNQSSSPPNPIQTRNSSLDIQPDTNKTSQSHIENNLNNLKQTLNTHQPQPSPKNPQSIITYKKTTSKQIPKQTDLLKQHSTLQQANLNLNKNQSGTANQNHQPQKIKNQQQTLLTTLSKSKLLKLIFDHFCNISFSNTKKKTFEEMQTKNQTISLNKFMLFCKQFNIYSIIKFQLRSQIPPNQNTVSRVNTFQKTSEELMENNASLYLSKAGKNKMLEIPVKEVINFEKKMISMFRLSVQNNQKMDFENFVNAIQQIYTIFTRHLKEICPQQQFSTEIQSRKYFVSNILFIKNKESFQQKMDSLKIEFKGSLSYHFQPSVKRNTQKYLKKPLVMHGGRDTEQMKKELQVYQSTKFKKTEKWIGSQPQMIALYSKSRVFYKPTPAKTYETNDVIRLARRETGRMHTQSLFGANKAKLQAQQKNFFNKRPEEVTFSKIFCDKTNIFGEKLIKLEDKLVAKKQSKNVKKQLQNEDEIMKAYFENEKKTYGNEAFEYKSP